MIVSRIPSLLLQRFAAAAALTALGFCAIHSRADEPIPAAPSAEQPKSADLLAVLQPPDDGPRRGPEGGARSGGPDRRPDEGARGGQRGRGGGDRPPAADRPGQPGPGSLDARIARLEQKLDTVLSELRELRRDRNSPRYSDRGPGPRPGYGSFGMRSGAPRPPMGPPPFDRQWRDADRFGPPDRYRSRDPRDDRARGGGPPRGAERDRRDRDDDLSF